MPNVRALIRSFSLGNVPSAGARSAACFCLLLAFFCALPAFALPPQRLLLEPPLAAAENGVLTLSLSLTVDHEDGLRDLLKDGAVLELAISVTVERERSWWSNAEAADVAFSSVLRHDPLSRDFLVTVPAPDGDRELRDKNLTRLLFASWRKLSLPIISLETLRRNEDADEYAIAVSIGLHHTEVPPWLEKTLVFWSADVVPAEKRTVHFTMPERRDEAME
jgi:hypothetical protein